MRLLALLLAAAPSFAGSRSLSVPTTITLPSASLGAAGAVIPGAAIGQPAFTALPAALPAAGVSLPAPLAASAVAAGASARAASAKKGEGTQKSGAVGAQDSLKNVNAALAADGGAGKAAALSAAFDGSFEKGSIEEAHVAPAPGKGGRVDLSKLDPAQTRGMKRKKAEKKLKQDQVKLDELQQVLYADHKRKVLIVLQAMDTGGKDGTIRHVMRSLNPQGVQVTSFKKPTAEEAKQHYLDRIKKGLPGDGMIGIFNRSHYEDILAPTVYGTHSAAEIEKRYDEINAFEKSLTDDGWTVMKFFLFISKDEQKKRLQARLDEPDKNWKFSKADLESRKLWPKFEGVYEKILGRTNTPNAPWFIVPADNKWYRDYVVGRILKRALKRMKLKYPDPPADLPKTIPD
jgi:PPK2 family polyphosphate:nucleotide phosphotransferase